jgi:O-antigen/teichoic acid export membrane protein
MNNQQPNPGHKLNWKLWPGNLRTPFYKNSVLLFADYVVLAGIGFFFWILVARFYSPVDVGYGSAAISAFSLVSMLSLAGFNYTLVRFLPGAQKPVELINSCLTISGFIAIVISVVFLLGLDIWSPALLFIKRNLVFNAAFILSALAYTFVAIIHNVYMASRRADFVLTLDIIQSLLRIPLAVSLVLFFRSFGIAAAYGIAASVSVLLGLFFFISKSQKDYRPRLAFNPAILKNVWHYSAGSYLASLLIATPGWIMPIMVVNVLDSEKNAYFYIVWTIAGLLSSIPSAASQSLFVEGSHSEENLGLTIRKTLRFTYFLLIPAVIVILVFGSFFLSLFGAAYSINGLVLLRVMAVSSIFGGVITTYAAILRIKNKISELYIIYAIQTLIVLVGSYFLLPITGTLGIGYMWLGAYTVIGLYVGLNMRKYLSVKK